MKYYDTIKLMVNIFLIVIFLGVLLWLYKEMRIIKLEKRINKYSINNSRDHHSLFDVIVNLYLKIRTWICKILKKSNYFRKYSERYDKYIDKDSVLLEKGMDIVATKFLLAFLFVFVLYVSMIIQNDSILFSRVIIAFSLGYFSFDLFIIGKKRMVQYEMENSLLKAITIMNNSFKSGGSIIKTIEIVKNEIDGPLKIEFEKMYQDLSYGLELEVAFKRFNERVDLKDVKYITTSLSILNKTGGNIIDVFDSIEKTVFNNKKLDDELKNLSAASKALYRMLIVIPFIFVMVVFIVDNTYFMPFFTHPFGIFMMILAVIIYVIYIILVKKIMKIREY